jgi:hypothetical protein
MLSSTLGFGPLSPPEVGKYPLVVKLLKWIYNAHLPTPRYTSTWDPALILAYFEATAAKSLSKIQVARKVVTLLAITALLRCSEIASIQADSVIISSTQASFLLGKPRKAQHAGPLLRISIPAWPANEIICPVACLRAYILRTENERETSKAIGLFIGSTKPFKSEGSSNTERRALILVQRFEAGVE